MSWTLPKIWRTIDGLKSSLFNTYIRDNQLYLFNRPHNFVAINGTGTDFPIPSSYTSVPGVPIVDIETSGGDLEFIISFMVSGLNTRIITIDVLVNNKYYLSSYASRNTTEGLNAQHIDTNEGNDQQLVRVVIPNFAPGKHTFELKIKSNAGSCTMKLADAYVALGVREL